MELDLEELAAVVELLKGADFTEFRLNKGDLSLVVTRGVLGAESSAVPVAQPAGTTSPAPRPTTASALASSHQPSPPTSGSDDLQVDEVLILAPMLGTFYRSPKPGEQSFVEVGDKIEADAVVGIVEVMKLMSSITSGVRGEVTRILARDGELIEADQPLFVVRATP